MILQFLLSYDDILIIINSCFIVVPVTSLLKKKRVLVILIYILYWLLVIILENCFSFCWMGVSDENYRIVTIRSAHKICPHFFWRPNWIETFRSNGTKPLNFNVWCSPVTFWMINFWCLPNYWGHNHLSDLYFVFSILYQVDLVLYFWTSCCGSNSSALIIISILC